MPRTCSRWRAFEKPNVSRRIQTNHGCPCPPSPNLHGDRRRELYTVCNKTTSTGYTKPFHFCGRRVRGNELHAALAITYAVVFAARHYTIINIKPDHNRFNIWNDHVRTSQLIVLFRDAGRKPVSVASLRSFLPRYTAAAVVYEV